MNKNPHFIFQEKGLSRIFGSGQGNIVKPEELNCSVFFKIPVLEK